MPKKTLDQEIHEFIEKWDFSRMASFIEDTYPIFQLFDIEQDHDWIKNIVGEEDERNVRIIRMVYLISKFADAHAGRLSSLTVNFKNLWKRLENWENE